LVPFEANNVPGVEKLAAEKAKPVSWRFVENPGERGA
jgi:hypothetical protein